MDEAEAVREVRKIIRAVREARGMHGEGFIEYARRQDPVAWALKWADGEYTEPTVKKGQAKRKAGRQTRVQPNPVEAVPLYDLESLYERYRNAEAEHDMRTEETL